MKVKTREEMMTMTMKNGTTDLALVVFVCSLLFICYMQ